MKFGPLTADEAKADTNRLSREGFVVIRIEGAEPDSIWNFLFTTEEDAEYFQKSMEEISRISPGGRIENEVIEAVARNYQAVRYTFHSDIEAEECRSTSPLR